MLSMAVLFSTLLAPAQGTYAANPVSVGGKARVTNTDGDTIRIREGAGTNYRQIAEAYEGQVVTVLAGPTRDSKGRIWYKVDAPRGTGWIMGDFLAGTGNSGGSGSKQGSNRQAQQSAPPATRITGYARVANTDGDRLRLRSAASTNGSVLLTLAPGTLVAVNKGPVTDGEGIVWYQVSVNGTTGWAMAQYLAQAEAPDRPAGTDGGSKDRVQTSQSPQQPAQQSANEPRTGTPRGAEQPASTAPSNRGAVVVSNAMKFLGYRYRFGGASPAGFDCSGFVYYVMRLSGISIGRDMYSQLNSGPRISTRDLQPGDLLFWSNTYKRGLSHAGIYIGNGKFIHAENESTGVTISSMYTAYWASRFTAAVRPR